MAAVFSPVPELFLRDTAFFRAFSLMSSCVGIRSLLAFRSPEHGGAGEAMLGGCCVLRCEGRADMCSLFLAGWRVVMAVCRPWFSQLKVRVTLRCLLLVSRAFISRRVFDDTGKYASCFACSNLTHLGVLRLLFTAVCGNFYRLPLCTVHPCLGCVIVCDACVAKLNASAASANCGHCAEIKISS